MLVKTPLRIISFNGGLFGPPGSKLYYVKDGDNWENVARRDGWANARDFVEYNFQTREPEEINWYLQNFVGCTVSHDGKNYSFSSRDEVRMTDGTSQRGHIFTRNDIEILPPVPLDDNDVARQAVLQVLADSAALSQIQFSMFGFHVNQSWYGTIRKHIEKRWIRVRYNSGLGADGRYDWEPDILHLGFTTAAGVNERSLIIHELTHAIMDEKGANWLDRRQSEAIAFAAQCIYADFKGYALYNQLPGIPARGDDRKFEAGDQIAQYVRRTNRTVSEHLEKKMMSALSTDTHYRTKTGTTYYNGISEKDPVWRDPTIPSQI